MNMDGQETTSNTAEQQTVDHPEALPALAGADSGNLDRRPPLVLLHGLTFDRSLWNPVLAELDRVDPGRRVLALDLPGHGQSPRWPFYDLESVADGVHRAVEQAQLESPVVVGHSISAIIATLYAARHPSRGVVNVDQSLQVSPFARLVRSLADKLRGPAFPAVWEMFETSMQIERLPESAQTLVRSTSRPRQELVLGYWQQLLERPIDEIVDLAAAALTALRDARVPYLLVAGDPLEPDYQQWLSETLPQVEVDVWARSGHFPQLAHPERFAQRLAITSSWTVDPAPHAEPAISSH
jgi:pimeloyl-ACP methyl ester carboxylesterase